MGKHLNKNIFWFSLILMFISKIEAQSNDCDCKINSLSELYVIGQFSALKNNLKCCINSDDKLSLRNTNRMRELLALTAIAEDSISLASRYLNDIVLSNANYSPENQNIIFDF